MSALDELDRPDGVIEMTPQTVAELVAEVRRLRVENWQLKGALGYEVPGHIPCGDFKCGLCEAKDAELQRLRERRQLLLQAVIEYEREALKARRSASR